MKIGLLGGTFDPPHLGHLILAEYSLSALELDFVLFIPAGENPFKIGMIRSSVEHRVAMLELAIVDNPRFRLSRIDLDRSAPHYSADMVALVHARYPNDDLYFLLGGDTFTDFPRWKNPEAIYALARLAVMHRADEKLNASMHDERLPQLSERVTMLENPLLSAWLSSTELVKRFQAGHTIRYLIPEAVLAYIQRHKLYSEAL